MGARTMLFGFLALGGCGAPVEPAFCNRASTAIHTANNKGSLCLAVTSMRMEPDTLGTCEHTITEVCSGLDIARVEQWMQCWEAIPACSSRGAQTLIAAGKNCADDADLMQVLPACLALFGERSAR